MSGLNTRRISKSIAALLCLSSSTALSWSIQVQAVPSMLAQSAPETSATNCRAKRQQNQEALGSSGRQEEFIVEPRKMIIFLHKSISSELCC